MPSWRPPCHPPAAQDLSAPIALRDVEDLHAADLDGVLADARGRRRRRGVGRALAASSVGGGRRAVLAHALGSRALLLAVR